jgi:hypothetical protein
LFTLSRKGHIYNAVNDTWTEVGSSRFNRLGAGLVNVNGRIFALGASDVSGNTKVIEEFNIATNTW